MRLEPSEVTELDRGAQRMIVGGTGPAWILGYVIGALIAASLDLLSANTYMPG